MLLQFIRSTKISERESVLTQTRENSDQNTPDQEYWIRTSLILVRYLLGSREDILSKLIHLQILTDYQWTLVSGPNTGTDLHVDPPFANSWNTLLRGHKLWAVMPADTEHSIVTCDRNSSLTTLSSKAFSNFSFN